MWSGVGIIMRIGLKYDECAWIRGGSYYAKEGSTKEGSPWYGEGSRYPYFIGMSYNWVESLRG